MALFTSLQRRTLWGALARPCPICLGVGCKEPVQTKQKTRFPEAKDHYLLFSLCYSNGFFGFDLVALLPPYSSQTVTQLKILKIKKSKNRKYFLFFFPFFFSEFFESGACDGPRCQPLPVSYLNKNARHSLREPRPCPTHPSPSPSPPPHCTTKI